MLQKNSKNLANLFLLVVVIGYLLTLFAQDAIARLGIPLALLRAFFEAALVGGLADWFAVTALFRHPLGIPIPHTAVIQKRKSKIADAFGGFVMQYFLSTPVLVEKFKTISITDKVVQYLSSQPTKDLIANLLAETTRYIEPKDLLASTDTKSTIQKLIASGFKSDLGEQLVRGLLQDRIINNLPWFIPSFIKDKLNSWLLNQVANNERCTEHIVSYIESEKFGLILEEALNSQALKMAIGDLLTQSSWQSILEKFSQKLVTDTRFKDSLEEILQKVCLKLVDSIGKPFSRYLTKTINDWDKKQAADLLESQFGDDLQYIRINGTILGGIIGLVLYLINSLPDYF